jgi:hemolysin activation/secretion protein
MNLTEQGKADRRVPCRARFPGRRFILTLLCLGWWIMGLAPGWAAESSPGTAGFQPASDAAPNRRPDAGAPTTNAPVIPGIANNTAPGYWVTSYVVKGNTLLSTNVLIPLLARHTGANVSLEEIVKAAGDAQAEYRKQGYFTISIAFAKEQITNGVVTFNVFQTAVPQIVVSGATYRRLTNNAPAIAPVLAQQPPVTPTTTNAAPSAIRPPATPVTPAQIAGARSALLQTMSELAVAEKDTRIHVVSTNAGPRFAVEKYMILGDTVLPPETIAEVLTNIDGAFGTNVSFDAIRTVVEQLQEAYRERGYVTVVVHLPPQKLTNETVKLQALEGRLANITVTGNRYFSSNNVMRSVPSLHTNMLLNGPIFQAELNRANANQDRQIYPVVGPGPDPGTSDLTLKVKDQLPVHGKIELNNENSPGTPDLRINSSAVADNLWQEEHSLGVQYGFSPELYKVENQWPFYDAPVVANYSGFYRLPLGSAESLEDTVNNNPGNFGYDEATRKFNLPPASGRPELNFFASRSTIDTGLATTTSGLITPPGSNPNISEQDVEISPTVNEDVGGRLTLPLPASENYHASFSGGVDFKTYELSSFKTNIFAIVQTNFDKNNNPILPPVTSVDNSPNPPTINYIEYLPLTLRYDANWRDLLGNGSFGLGLSVNPWFYSHTSVGSGTNEAFLHGVKSLQNITGSGESSGNWVVINPSFSHDFMFFTNWLTTVRADGQWASEPMISTEQYGAGGINSVRGYHEGEVFGDAGGHVSLEQQTPPHIVGVVYGNTPLTVRGLVYMDYARVYLLDPQGRPDSTPLWSTGFGLAASAGPHWQTQFLFSLPLLSAGTTEACQPVFTFALTAQF